MLDAYRRVDNALLPRIVVDVNGHASQRRDLGRQLVQARVVLALALVRFGHDGKWLFCLDSPKGSKVE